MTHSGYYARQSHAHATFDKAMSSTAADFRSLTRLVLAEALVEAGTTVCAPVHRFELEVPEDAARVGARRAAPPPGRAAPRRPCAARRRGAGRRGARRRGARASSSGSRTSPAARALLTATLDHFAPVVGPPPRRVRVGPDPYAVAHDSRGCPAAGPPGEDSGGTGRTAYP